MSWNRTHPAIFLLALAILTFIPFVGHRDITTSHEARVVQVARQMAEAGWPWDASPVQVPKVELESTPQGERLMPAADGSGMQVNPWIVPIMNGQVRLQKPPLPYWCNAVLYKLFGFSEMASRIIPALMGTLSVLLVWDLSRRLGNRLIAWYAGLIWLSTFFIVDEFRKAMADPYLAFFTLLAIWAWIRGPRMGWRLLFYIAVAMAILSKGPLILIFVVPFIIVHALLIPKMHKIEHSPARSERAWHHLAGVVVLLMLTLPWPVAVLRAVPNAPELWRYESLGALTDKVEDLAPWWFYLPNMLMVTLPWAPVFLMGMWGAITHRTGKRLAATAVAVIVVAIFSCSHSKKSAYLLPLSPLLCLIAAQGLAWLGSHRRLRPARLGIGQLTLLAVVFSVLIQIVLGIQTWRDNGGSPRDAAGFVTKLLSESNRRSLMISRMPEDATSYLPLGLVESPQSDEVYVILDNRKDRAQATVERITETAAGPVVSREHLPVPDSKVTRWRVYRLTVSPIQRPAPRAG